MDRFMMKAVLTYPTAQEEQRMLAMLTRRGSDTVDQHALTGDTVSISDVEFLRSCVGETQLGKCERIANTWLRPFAMS